MHLKSYTFNNSKRIILTFILFSLIIARSLSVYSQVLVSKLDNNSNYFSELLIDQILVSNLNSNILPSQLGNSISSSKIFLPLNGCGGGCGSSNPRCCGVCSSGDYGTGIGCPNDYHCSKV